MEWYGKLRKSFFVNNFSQYLLKFLEDKAGLAGRSNSDKWSLFFEKVEHWKNRYCISSELVTLYGVNGWYVDFRFSRFKLPDSREYQIEEYAAILLFIDLVISCDGDAMEFECLKNTEFEEYFQYYDYPVEENAVLSKTQFCDELQHLYNSSFERFQYYVNQPAKQNPNVIEKLELQYPIYINYMDFFRSNIRENSKIVRLNSFGRDEDIWYVVPVDFAVFLIAVREII